MTKARVTETLQSRNSGAMPPLVVDAEQNREILTQNVKLARGTREMKPQVLENDVKKAEVSVVALPTRIVDLLATTLLATADIATTLQVPDALVVQVLGDLMKAGKVSCIQDTHWIAKTGDKVTHAELVPVVVRLISFCPLRVEDIVHLTGATIKSVSRALRTIQQGPHSGRMWAKKNIIRSGCYFLYPESAHLASLTREERQALELDGRRAKNDEI